MGIAKLYGQKASGTNINGILKDYHAYAGENISAGDLVEYINGVAGQGTETSTDTAISTAKYSGRAIIPIELDENKVLILHCMDVYYLYGIIVTISGATITLGTDTQLSTDTYSGYALSAKLIDNGRVFVAYTYGGSKTLNALIVTVSGTTLSYGSWVQLQNTEDAGTVTSVEVLESGNVFVAYNYSGYIRGIVCTISGTTIAKGTATTLVSGNSYVGKVISTTLLPNDNVFIAHSFSSSYYLYGIVITVSGTTMTVGTDTAIISTEAQTGYHMSTSLLPNGNIFVAHSGGGSYALYGIIVAVSDKTITFGTDTAINSGIEYTGYRMSTVVLPNGDVFIAHSFSAGSSTHMYLYGIICFINETTITKGTETLLNNSNKYVGGQISSVLLSNNSVFVAHSSDSSYYLYAQIWGIDEVNNIPTNVITIPTYETQVRKTTTSQFDGIAKTSGVGGDNTGHKDLVSIYTLERPPIENLIMNGDFNDGLNGWNINSTIWESSVTNGVLVLQSLKDNGTIHVANLPTYYSNIPNTHIIYIKGKYSSNLNSGQLRIACVGIDGIAGEILYYGNTTNLESFSYRCTSGTTVNLQYVSYGIEGSMIGDTLQLDDLALYDLTAYYGEGNEPTLEWCDANL